MRGSYTALLALTIVVLLPISVFAQGIGINSQYLEFNILGGGARAAGMGGAFLGISEGEMGFSWNPAGMLSNDKTKFGIQLASISDKFNSVSIISSQLYPDASIEPVELKREHFSLNYGGFVIPFEFLDRHWAAGGGFRNVLDMIGEYTTPGFSNSVNTYKQDRGVDAASLSFAGEIIDQVSLGITINDYLRNSESNYRVGSIFQYVSPNEIDTSIVDLWNNENSHFSGANLDIGLAADYSMIKAGFVFHTPYNLKQNIRFTQYLIVPPQPVGAIDRVSLKYNMPSAISAGLAVAPMEKLTMAVDFSTRSLSGVEIKYDWEQVAIPDTTIDPEWQDLTQFRIGAEYMLDAGFADIPLRAGFRNEPAATREILDFTYDAVGDSTITTYGDQITTNIITFGSGLYFDRSWIDIAYQFGSSSYDRTVDFGTPQTFEVKRDYSRLIMSIGMYF